MYEGSSEREHKVEEEIEKTSQVQTEEASKEDSKEKSGPPTNFNTGDVPSGGACVRDTKKKEQLKKSEDTVSKHHKKSCLKDSKYSEKISKSPAGCSKFCSGIKDGDDHSYKFTVCTSAKKNQLAYRMKRSKRKIGQISNQVKKGTKKSVNKLKDICKSISAKKALGFKCDLRKCGSALVDCSRTSCTKSDMLFSRSKKEKAGKLEGGERHDNPNFQQTGTMTCEMDANRKQNDKSIVTVEDKETNT